MRYAGKTLDAPVIVKNRAKYTGEKTLMTLEFHEKWHLCQHSNLNYARKFLRKYETEMAMRFYANDFRGTRNDCRQCEVVNTKHLKVINRNILFKCMMFNMKHGGILYEAAVSYSDFDKSEGE